MTRQYLEQILKLPLRQAFFRPSQNNSRTKKLKIQGENLKTQEKTQGFSKFWCSLVQNQLKDQKIWREQLKS